MPRWFSSLQTARCRTLGKLVSLFPLLGSRWLAGATQQAHSLEGVWVLDIFLLRERQTGSGIWTDSIIRLLRGACKKRSYPGWKPPR